MTREEAIKGLKVLRNDFSGYKPNEDMFDMAIKVLEQEPSNDMVSRGVFEQVMWERDVAIEQLKELGYGFGEKPKTGHWIKHDGYWECSECHTERAYGNEYCPDCGSHNGDIAKPYKESEG